MAVSLGDIIIFFRGEDSDVQATFDSVERRAQQMSTRVGDVVTRGISGPMRGLAGMLQSGFRLFFDLTILRGIDAVRNSLGGMFAGMVSGNDQFDQFNLRFTTLLKSADAAQTRLGELAAFGARTPFELPEVVQADQILQAFGFHAADVVKKYGMTGEQIREITGDVASGVGRPFDEIASLLGRFASGATGEALMRFGELGIVTRDQLRTMGIEFNNAGALMSPLPQAMTAVLQVMQQKYGGLMEAQSMTLEGMRSNLADWFSNAQRIVGQPLFEGLRTSLGILLQFLNGPEAQAGVQALAQGMQSLVTNIGSAIQAILPFAAMVAGVMIPLVQMGAEWGRSFTEAFATGVQMAANLVAEALSAIANIVTSLLQPGSPPKILPQLDRWGMLAAQEWMNGWGRADTKVFSEIAKSAQTALQVAQGRGLISQGQVIPTLNATRTAIAQMIQSWREHGTVSEESLNRVRRAAGPAGEQVVDLARAYMEAEQASRAVADAQEQLNSVTEEYDAILGPLNAQLDGVRRQMDRLRDNKKLAEIQARLRSGDLKGEDRQMLQLEMQEIQLKQNISTQQAAKNAAVDAAKQRLDAAKKAEEAANAQLEAQKAALDTQKEALDLAKQQASTLNSLAKNSAGASSAMKNLGQSQAQINEAVQEARRRAEELRNQYTQLKTRMEEAFARGRAIVQPVIDGITDGVRVVQFFIDRLRGVEQPIEVMAGRAQAVVEVIGVTWTVRILSVVAAIRQLSAAFRLGAEAGGVFGGLAQVFYRLGESSPILNTVGDIFARIGDAVDRFRARLAAGGLGAALLGAAGDLVGAVQELVQQVVEGFVSLLPEQIRSRVPLLTGLLIGAFAAIRAAPIVGTIAAPIAAAFGGLGAIVGPAIAGLSGLLGPILGGLGAVGAAAAGAVPGLLGLGRVLGGGLVATFTTFLRGGIGPVLAGFRGFAAALLNPMAILAALRGALTNPIGLLRGLGGALLALRNPIGILFTFGRSILGLVSPVGIVITLIGLFASSWASNFGGIRDIVTRALGPVMELLSRLGAILSEAVGPLLRGDVRGAFAILRNGLNTLGPLLGQVGASLRTALPQIAVVLFQFATELIGQLIGLIQTYGPPLLAAIGQWAQGFIAWVGPQIPPLLIQLGVLLGQLLDWIGAQVPGLIEWLGTWAAAFVEWALAALPDLLSNLGLMLVAILAWIVERAPGIVQQLLIWAQAFGSWVIDRGIPLLLASLLELGRRLLNFIVTYGPGILAQLGSWAVQFAAWIPGAIGQLIFGLGTLLGQFLTWIVQNGPGILAQLAEWSTQFNTWITELSGKFGEWFTTVLLPKLLSALGQLALDAWNGFVTLWNNAWKPGTLGGQIIDNLKQGILDNWENFKKWALGKVQELASWFDPRSWFGGGAQPATPTTATPATTTTTTTAPARPAGRQHGGPVERNTPYVVGEAGPELFIPQLPGMVVPNNLLDRLATSARGGGGAGGGGGGGISVVLSMPISITGGIDSPERVDQLATTLEARMTRAVGQAISTIIRGGIK